MPNLSVRGVDEKTLTLLKTRAIRKKTSVNALIVQWLQQSVGTVQKTSSSKKRYHDLDHLAGTWSSEDVLAFEKTQESFIKVDKELWK